MDDFFVISVLHCNTVKKHVRMACDYGMPVVSTRGTCAMHGTS